MRATAGGREAAQQLVWDSTKHRLTYEIGQQDGEQYCGSNRWQSRTFPAAVLGGLFQLERISGESISRQQSGRWCVNRSWGQRVSRGRTTEERSCSRRRFEQEVPEMQRNWSQSDGEQQKTSKSSVLGKEKAKQNKERAKETGKIHVFILRHLCPQFAFLQWCSRWLRILKTTELGKKPQ